MSQPPKSTMRAPSATCRSYRGVRNAQISSIRVRRPKKSGRRAARRAPAAPLSLYLRDQAPACRAAPLRWADLPEARRSPEPVLATAVPFLVPERFRAEIAPSASGGHEAGPLRTDLFDGARIIAVTPPAPLQLRRASLPNIRPATRPSVDVAGLPVGGGAPIVVQSMTNTDTADIAATVRQVRELARRRLGAGAHHGQHRRGRRGGRADPRRTGAQGCTVPLIGDFHFNGHKLLQGHIRPAPRRSPSTASTRATSAAAASATRSSPS